MNSKDAPIIVEQIFDKSPQEVWEAITVLEQMTQWYFSNIPAFEAVVGFETRFVVAVEDRVYPHYWKVTEVLPQKRLAYEWEFEGYEGKSLSLFEVMEVEAGTKLRLTASTIAPFSENIPEFKRESGVAGWNYFIRESLKAYLEKEE